MDNEEMAFEIWKFQWSQYNTRFNFSLLIYSAILVATIQTPQIYWWGLSIFGIIMVFVFQGLLLRNWIWIDWYYNWLYVIHTHEKREVSIKKVKKFQDGVILPKFDEKLPLYKGFRTKDFLRKFSIVMGSVWILIGAMSFI